MPTIERVTLRPRSTPGPRPSNILTVKVPDIRRAYVLLQRSIDTRRDTSDIWWTLSAWVTLSEPLIDSVPTSNLVNLAPSLLDIAPLGASLMLVAGAFWTGLPTAESISIKFSTSADEPQGDAQAFGVGDATPHPEFDPRPEDPRLLQRLQIEGRIPPPYPPRRALRER